jgi:hypothetical protein
MSKLHPRKNFTQTQREQLLQDYRRSKLTQRKFVAQAGIGLTTLQLWLRQAGQRASVRQTEFVELPNLLSGLPASSTYRLHLAGGVLLEVSSGFRAEELTTLLQVLRQV